LSRLRWYKYVIRINDSEPMRVGNEKRALWRCNTRIINLSVGKVKRKEEDTK